MCNNIIKTMIAALIIAPTASFSAIPVRWTTDCYKVKPLVYECYHGETLDLAASLTAYGEPMDLSGKTAKLYWQTNGMESAWWSTNATVKSEGGVTNVLSALWSGAYDTGADSVNGFIGVEGENYRAAFNLRMRASPGFVPSRIEPPIKYLDFAYVTVTNIDLSPWIQLPGDSVPYGWIVIKGTNGVEWVRNEGVNTNVVNDIIVTYDTTNLTPRIDERILMPSNTVPVGRLLAKATNGVEWIFFQGGGGSLGSITMVKDTTNGWHKVRAELNPVGQIVLSIEQDVSTNKLLTIEEERDRAMGAELQNTYLITTETVRSINEDEDLSERIDAISSVGRFLSTWDCTTGRPGTEPKVSPMPYKAGDYYLVASVSETITNYVPVGTVYTNGSASTAFTTNSVAPNDLFRHTEDGSWVHVSMSGVSTTFALINGEPRDNAKLARELDDAATNLLGMVIAETNRATAAENFIRTSLSNETARAYVAETNLQHMVEAETNRAYVAETNIMQIASNETVRAYAAETNLQYMVEAETNRAYVVETNIISMVEAETNRAYVAETNIAASVSNETIRAYCAETNIQHQVNVETNRAYVAETNLQHMVEAETNRAYVAETNLLALVVVETNRAWIAETNLAHQISSEYDRATNAERVVSVSATNYTDAVGTALHDEITNVEHQVVAETNRAQAAEQAISSAIADESVRAYAAETNLAASIVAETNRAQTAEASISVSVVAEHDRAYAAETNIAASATNYTDVATNALGAAVVGMISGLDARLVSETNRAQTVENDLYGKLVAETNRAQTAEHDLDVRIAAETNRAQTAEAAIATSVTNETIRAYTAETNQFAKIVAVSNIAESAVKVEVDPTATAKANAAIADAGCVTTNESGDIINTINNIYATGVLSSQQELSLIHDGSLYAFTYYGFSSGTVGSLDNWKMPWADDYGSDKTHAIALLSHVTNEEHRASVAETNLHERIVAETNRSITADAQLAAHKRDVRDLALVPYLDDMLFPITDADTGASVTEHYVVKNADNTYTLKDEGGVYIANFGTDGKLTGDSLKWLFNGLHLSSYAAKTLVHDGDRLARLSEVPATGVTFDSALQKTNALNQIETSRIDIIALGDKEAEQDEEISKLGRKSYWVGSIATLGSATNVDEVLNAYVTNTMHRAAAEGDQVTVTDIHTVYQKAADTHWKVFTDSGAVEHASGTQYGVVKVGSGIDVTNGVISVTKDNSIRVFATLDFEAWVDSAANVPVESSVLVYADTTTGGGIAAAALYRIYKKDASTVVVDAYVVGNGKLYRKIKVLGSWGSFAEIGGGGGGGGSAEWGSIGGNLADQIDLQSVLVSKLNTSDVVQNLNDTNPQHAASIVALANVGKRLVVVGTQTELPATGAADALYVGRNDLKCWVWGTNSQYNVISGGGGGVSENYRDKSDYAYYAEDIFDLEPIKAIIGIDFAFVVLADENFKKESTSTRWHWLLYDRNFELRGRSSVFASKESAHLTNPVSFECQAGWVFVYKKANPGPGVRTSFRILTELEANIKGGYQKTLEHSSEDNGKVLGVTNNTLAWVEQKGGGSITNFTDTLILNGDEDIITGPFVIPHGYGETGQILVSQGSNAPPEWSEQPIMVLNGTITNKVGSCLIPGGYGQKGQLLVGNGATAPTWLANGTAGQMLVSGGANADPTWKGTESITFSPVSTVTSSRVRCNKFGNVITINFENIRSSSVSQGMVLGNISGSFPSSQRACVVSTTSGAIGLITVEADGRVMSWNMTASAGYWGSITYIVE